MKTHPLLQHLLVPLAIIMVGLITVAPAAAQWKPDKNIEFVIGTGPGGALDRTARLIQQIWREHKLIDTPAVIVNKPGAGQALALIYLNQHASNAHYLTVASGILFSNHLTGKTTIAYTDLTPIAVLFDEATVFAVKADGPYRTATSLLEALRKDPYGPSFAVGSTLGSATHIAAVHVVKTAGGDPRKMKAVVFNSSGDSITALLGGHVDVVPVAASLALPHVQSGKLRLIAVASPQRLSGPLADVPTWKELGVNGAAANWRGVFGPRGLTTQQVAYWEGVFARTVKSPQWTAEMARNAWGDELRVGREAKKYYDADHAAVKAVLGELGLLK